MEPDGNQLSPGYLVCNVVYTSTGKQKLWLYVEIGKIQKSVLVLMSTVAIPKFGIKFEHKKRNTTR